MTSYPFGVASEANRALLTVMFWRYSLLELTLPTAVFHTPLS